MQHVETYSANQKENWLNMEQHQNISLVHYEYGQKYSNTDITSSSLVCINHNTRTTYLTWYGSWLYFGGNVKTLSAVTVSMSLWSTKKMWICTTYTTSNLNLSIFYLWSVNKWAAFNDPLDTLYITLETGLSRQSTAAILTTKLTISKKKHKTAQNINLNTHTQLDSSKRQRKLTKS